MKKRRRRRKKRRKRSRRKNKKKEEEEGEEEEKGGRGGGEEEEESLLVLLIYVSTDSCPSNDAKVWFYVMKQALNLVKKSLVTHIKFVALLCQHIYPASTVFTDAFSIFSFGRPIVTFLLW